MMLRVLLIKFVSLLPTIFFQKAPFSFDLVPSRYTFVLSFLISIRYYDKLIKTIKGLNFEFEFEFEFR